MHILIFQSSVWHAQIASLSKEQLQLYFVKIVTYKNLLKYIGPDSEIVVTCKMSDNEK